MRKIFKINNSIFRRNYNFLLKKIFIRKLLRFNKKNKRYFRRVFSKIIFRVSGNRSYPKFLIKKHFFGYSFNLTNLMRRNIAFFNRRFITRSKLAHVNDKASLLLIRSSSLLKTSSLKDLSVVKNLSMFNFFKKSSFRNKFALRSDLVAAHLIKSIALFSKKGNKNSIFKYVFAEILYNRSSLFKSFFQNFSDNDLIIDTQLIQDSFFYTSSRKFVNSNTINFFKFSILVRQFFGIFYKFIFRKFIKYNPFFIKFILNRFKKPFLLSSIRSLNSVFKPFYIYFEVKPWKKSGRSVIVPTPIKSKSRRFNMFSHWVKESTLARKENSISKKYIGEVSDLILRQGLSVQKLNSMRKTIKANRALIRKSRIVLV